MLRRISNASSSFGFLSPVAGADRDRDRRDSKHSTRSQDGGGALKTPTTATATTRNARSSSIATSTSYNGSTLYGDAGSGQESLDSAHALLVESIQALQGISPSAFAERLVLTSQISALLAEYPETRSTFR